MKFKTSVACNYIIILLTLKPGYNVPIKWLISSIVWKCEFYSNILNKTGIQWKSCLFTLKRFLWIQMYTHLSRLHYNDSLIVYIIRNIMSHEWVSEWGRERERAKGRWETRITYLLVDKYRKSWPTVSLYPVLLCADVFTRLMYNFLKQKDSE